MFHYWAFGLNISAEIEFPELFNTAPIDVPDLTIKLGSVPSIPNTPDAFKSEDLYISPNEYILDIENLASYHVQDGKTITIFIHIDADLGEVRLFCLSNAFAALLHQRRIIPLHASAFLFHGNIVMLMGASGVGKSTTLASLINKGYDPFSDDICVPLNTDQKEDWYAYSSYPMMKYWTDTLEKVEMMDIHQAIRLRASVNKYGLYFHDKFITVPKKIELIILLEKVDQGDAVTSRPLSGMESFSRLQDEVYRKEYLVHENLIETHFKMITAMANDLKVFLVTRPEHLNSHNNVVTEIEKILSIQANS